MKILERIIKENKEPLSVLCLKAMLKSSLTYTVDNNILRLYLPNYCWVGYVQDSYPYHTFYIINQHETYGLNKNNDYGIETFKNLKHGNEIKLYHVRELLSMYGIKNIEFKFKEKEKVNLLKQIINFFIKLFGVK